MASPAVTQEVAPCPRLPPFHSTLPVRKDGGWARVAANGRRGAEGMRSGEHRKKRAGQARGGEPGRPAPRGQDGGAGGGPGVRRGRGHSPPPPRRAAGPVRTAARRARPRAGRGVEERGGEGAARPTMQSARRRRRCRRHRPVAKVKGRVQPPRPPWRRRPALRRAAPRRGPAGLLLPQGRAPQQPRSRSRVCGRRPRHGGQGASRAGRRRAGAWGLERPGRRGGSVWSGAAGRALAPPGSRRDRALLLFLSVKGQSS